MMTDFLNYAGYTRDAIELVAEEMEIKGWPWEKVVKGEM